MRARIFAILALTGILISLNGCGYLSKKYLKTKSEEHKISTVDKKKIYLENITGNIVIKQGSDSSQMTIYATKEIKVKKKDLEKPFDEINIRIETEEDVIRITTDYDFSNKNSFFKFGSKNKARVDYVITVPPGIDLSIENLNGNISSDNLSNDLSIDLVNGETDLKNYSGILECEIVNGSFSGMILNTNAIDINTVNGSVTLNLNNYINAELMAETVNGKISDTNLMIRKTETGKKELKGYIGSGTADTQIKVNTINGKISFIGTNEI